MTSVQRKKAADLTIAGIVCCLAIEVIALLVSGSTRVRDEARMAAGQTNLKQLGLALHFYSQAHGTLPPAVVTDANGKPLYSWRVVILPYVNGDDLYKQFHLNEPWDSPHNKELIPRMPPIFQPYPHALGYPDDQTFFRVFVGKGTPFEPGKMISLGAKDLPLGAANTLLIVEAGESVVWTKPDELPFEQGKPLPNLGGLWPKRMQAVMCDGSVRYFPKPLDEAAIREMIRIR